MPKKGKQYMLVSLIFAFVAVSAACLAGVVYLSQGGGAAPAAAKPEATVVLPMSLPDQVETAAPSLSAMPSFHTEARASAIRTTPPAVSNENSTTPLPATASPAPAATTPTVTSSSAPSPSNVPAVSASPSPTPAASSKPKKIPEKSMTIGALISRMTDRPFDPYGNICVVKRGDIAYYAWAQELFLFDGKSTRRILANADCDWMYVDESSNLWFGIEGGNGISGNKVQQWDSIYRFNRETGAFTLMRQESQTLRFPDGHGFAMVGPYYLYVDGGTLMACHTGTGAEIRIDTVCANGEIRAVEQYQAIYYQNARREYRMLSQLGEPGQSSIALDMSRFPGGVFQCEKFAIDSSNVLYRFRRTGYERVGKLNDVPAGAGIVTPSASSDGGIGFPGGGAVTLEFYDVAARAWQSFGNPAQEGIFCQATTDGHYWFVNWKPAVLFQIHKGKLAKYDLSGAMSGCTWAGLAGDMVFLSEQDFYYKFTHVFLPDTQALYEITFPPLPGDQRDN